MVPPDGKASVMKDHALPYCTKCDSHRVVAVLDEESLVVLFACLACQNAVFPTGWFLGKPDAG